jgi:cystathionine gamma-lyase/cystathionine beta-lyase/cystathionine gamma-lyase/homocysteine desulfhydrase
MRQHDANGRMVAEFLSKHPKVKQVFYPGLPSHPGHAIAARQQKGFGSMMSFELGSKEAANAFVRSLKLCYLAESLGGVETLVSHSASMTHAAMTQEQRDSLGITDGLIRLSVGCEDVEDILADLEQALEN